MRNDSGATPRVLGRDDAEALVGRTLAIMADLERVLARESESLRKGRLRQGLSEEARKSELTGSYLRALEQIKANAVALKRLAPEAAERLKEAHRRFADVVANNQAIVATARAVSEALVKSISDEMHRATRTQGYGPASSGHARAPRDAPLVVSRNL